MSHLKFEIPLLLAALLFSLCATAGTTHTVKMKSISYEPKVLEVKVGDEVQWENTAFTEHSATSDESGVFDTGLIAPKAKSKLIKLETAGTFSYHCSVHGKTMHGQIQVSK